MDRQGEMAGEDNAGHGIKKGNSNSCKKAQDSEAETRSFRKKMIVVLQKK